VTVTGSPKMTASPPPAGFLFIFTHFLRAGGAFRLSLIIALPR